MPKTSGRAGRYVKQLGGYRAFIPKPLPPDPPLNLDDALYTMLSKADRALGRLDGSIQTLPNPDLFIFMYVRKEAVLSSRIEGTQSSINDILEAEARLFNEQRRHDVAEVLNYVEAMHYGLSRLQELPFSVRLVREIHERLMHGLRGQHQRPGEVRHSQNWIGPTGCTLNEATFVPPPPEDVEDCLGDLETFYHRDAANVPALIKIGLAHAQFETIHPFLDGNGRVGRLLITFMLCEQKILIQPLLYLSYFFREHQQRYYQLLQGTRDTGDWESWLRFFLDGVAQVSNEATETARRIVALREGHRQSIQTAFGRAAANGLMVLEHLYERPIVQINDVKDLLDVTHSGATGVVDRFVDAGLLVEIPGRQRNRRFRYASYIDLFAEPDI